MSTVDCAVITNLGHALLGKVLAGKSGIHFTSASVGDGVISEGKSPEELTELVHEIKAGDISGVDNPGSGEVRVSIQVSSLGVSVGFFVKEIGIFATDPDLGEILYAYVGMPDKPQWIRPEGASINTLAIFDVYVAVSRAAEVTAQICPSAMVHISDFESYKTYVETQLSNKMGFAGYTGDVGTSPEKTKPGIWLTNETGTEGLPAGWHPKRNILVRFWVENLSYSLDLLSGRYNQGKLAFRTPDGAWHQLATADLNRYDLPLMEGYANCGSYFANDTAVTISLYCYKSDKSAITPNSTITMLPAGYRPVTTMPFLGLCTNFTAGSDNRWPCYLMLHNDGRLEMSQIGTSVSNVEPKEIYASFTFVR